MKYPAGSRQGEEQIDPNINYKHPSSATRRTWLTTIFYHPFNGSLLLILYCT